MDDLQPMELTPEALRQAQKGMLHIMKAIHRVCVKHHIRYWLDYGTLLGAVRHGGFIPWDDDMDICMMREDFDHFCRVAPEELKDEFFLQTPESDPTFFGMFAKLRLKGTIWLEHAAALSNLANVGLFVDIFPMDTMPQGKLAQWWTGTFYDQMLNGIRDYKLFGKSGKTFGKTIVKRLLAPFFSLSRIQRLQRKKLRALQANKTSPYISKLCMDCKTEICERSLFDELILYRFETEQFYVPARYEERLRSLFGDYLQLPPEDQRYNRHAVVKFDFGKYASLD
jgi:lipopolysaccharide cholinephosphotransferase